MNLSVKKPTAPPIVKKSAPSLKPLLPIFDSAGVSSKPDTCKLCPFHTKSSGFAPDWYPDAEEPPKLGFLLDFPAADDVLEGRPWAGRAGYAWEKRYLKPFGLSLSSVYIGHVIRCLPKEKRFGKPLYPIGNVRRGAELTCRQHDGNCWGGPSVRPGGIKRLDPNLFVVTFHPSDALLTPALSRLILADIKKAFKRAQEGYRPLVIMGTEAKELVAPWLKGGIKTWRGTYWKGSWPFKEGSMLTEPRFLEI